jgi:hypothetical protein
MIDIDATIVRCPVGHGLFIISGSPSSGRCPGCGALLIGVHDDAPLAGVGFTTGIVVSPSLDCATELVSDLDALLVSPDAALALSV